MAPTNNDLDATINNINTTFLKGWKEIKPNHATILPYNMI
jgi:hypothetical protein